MPTYEYSCKQCGQTLEVYQPFSAKPLRVHPDCGGELKKVFHPSGVVFKGSGFYATDSRGSSAKSTSNDGETTTSSNGSRAKKAETKAKPAAEPKPSS